MPKDRKPDAAPALTNAERQANYRARRQALQAIPAIRYRRPADRRSRPQRWHDAVAELLALQAEYAAWLDTLPDSLSQTPSAEALQDMVELDLRSRTELTESGRVGRASPPRALCVGARAVDCGRLLSELAAIQPPRGYGRD
jgi:hypothetical protein